MNNNFKIVISSDLKYDDLCAEIYYKEHFVAIITQEKGFENLEIEIYSPSNDEKWRFQFSKFIEILEKAKKNLWSMRKK